MKDRERQHGFSLLEILVAFSIMALALGVLLRVFSINVQLAAVSDDYIKAVLLAESRLADATAGALEEGESQGTFDGRFQWRITVSSYDPGFEELDLDNLSVTPYRVRVKVEWGDETRPRSVTLTTLRLKAKS